jgi:hypothetical protein
MSFDRRHLAEVIRFNFFAEVALRQAQGGERSRPPHGEANERQMSGARTRSTGTIGPTPAPRFGEEARAISKMIGIQPIVLMVGSPPNDGRRATVVCRSIPIPGYLGMVRGLKV